MLDLKICKLKKRGFFTWFLKVYKSNSWHVIRRHTKHTFYGSSYSESVMFIMDFVKKTIPLVRRAN
jgi:hypothetical protein